MENEIMETEKTGSTVTHTEHKAIVFKLNRKQAAAVARYLKDHASSKEVAFAVDVDTLEMIIQAQVSGEDDYIALDGEEDVFDIEEEEIETEEEVWEEIEEEAAETETEE